MKYFKFMPFFTIVFLTISSCSDLDLENIGTQTAESYFNDENNALAGLNSCYSSMSKDEYFVYGDLMSDDALKGGSDLFDWVDRQYIRDFTANAGNGVSSGTWSLLYTGIVRCNEIINSLPAATFDQEVKERIIAEAKFLRAYAYSKLVVLFGGVPLVTSDLTVENLKMSRATVQEVYALIKTDLDEAIAFLPEKGSYSVSDLGRATKGAARALKARVLIQETSYINNAVLSASNGYSIDITANWNEVYNLTSAIIGSGQYALVANYASIFEMDGENNIESIFEVQHETTNNEWGESVGNTTVVQMGNRDDWGWCFNLPTDALYNAYGNKDPRREATIYGQEFDVLYGIKQTWEKQVWTLEHSSTKDFVSACRLNRKYALPSSERHGNHNNQPNNKRVIRYAEVLLMHAEAAYMKGDQNTARTYVNMIRERAQNSTYPLGSTLGQVSGYSYDPYPGASVPPITFTGDELLEAIWNERRIELAMEGIRYFDIVRTGRIDLLPETGNYEAHDGLLPIPLVDVNTFGLDQNKGY